MGRPLFRERELGGTSLDAALDYARRGWPVFPARGKRPLTTHGHLDATTDPETILAWWRRAPNALVAIATGERSGVVALDIDLRPEGSGWDSLEALGVYQHPETPTAHSPSGGCHPLFAWPGRFIKTVAGALGPFLDIRGDGGSLVLPPGPGRFWDPHLGPDTPLAPMPEWMVIPESQPLPETSPRPRPTRISRFAEVALDRAVENITKAPNGQQYNTLNRETYSIAQLVAGGVMPAPLAIEALCWAAHRMTTHDPRRPWRNPGKLVDSAFLDGLRHPRRPGSRR